MEAAAETRSALCGPQQQQPNNHFSSEDLRRFMPPPPPDSSTSFTALLELPPTQAVELLVHSTESLHTPPLPPPPSAAAEEEVKMGGGSCSFSGFAPPLFPADMELVGRAAKFSVFATPGNSPELKQEQIDSDFNLSDTTFQTPTNKRKGREKKVKESNKRNKKHMKETSEDEKNGSGEKLPYVHVRARRGQATDSHSLAERARREKINARMKLLQELVPGCNKISGTASVLDEIINHVQSLQRQVEFLSMRLAAVNPSIDVNLDAFMTAENGSHVESNYFPGITMPSVWPEEQIRPQYQQLWQLDGFQQSVWIKEEDNSNLVPP